VDIGTTLERTIEPVDVAYLLDVDGVVSDPFKKRVTEPKFFSAFAAALLRGDVVALNTGRSISWLLERIIEPLRGRVLHDGALAHFSAFGEKGAAWVWFDHRGTMHRGKDDDLSLAGAVRDQVRGLVKARYADWMFFDETKETMISVEIRDGCDPQVFSSMQHRLEEDLSALFRTAIQAGDLRIDGTTIATDVQHGSAGKALGARRFIDLLTGQRLRPSRFVAFGDSDSDLDMADELHRQGRRVEFVYVSPTVLAHEFHRPYAIKHEESGRGALRHLDPHP